MSAIAPGSLLALPDGPALAVLPEVVDHVAVARLYGEPLFAMPQDLYSRRTRWRSFWRPLKAHWTCCSI